MFQVEEDEINDIDQWSTWPGYLALALRMIIAIWFIYDLTRTFAIEVTLLQMTTKTYDDNIINVWSTMESLNDNNNKNDNKNQ